ncbi:uncharacterized protein [Aegilops tauschii subsp. strangulata]|uniref:uncharacterized protein n=1 Tax=Aegilops tauschii subsp. strangulata TaxID=200361 RepID=UPI003CC865C0
MSTLSWNCRGLGNPWSVQELRKVVKKEGPALLFVMETKIKGKKVEELKTSLGFSGCFAVDSDGLSGGIGLFWSRDVDVTLQNYSIAHIDVTVKQENKEWRFTGFYGAPRVENRHHSWCFLRTLFALPHQAWICMGDFNETLYAEEHFGTNARPESQMRAFREAMEECSLQDLGWRGVPFTWDNRQSGAANVKARLDRALANAAFPNLFQFTMVKHISSAESDHHFVLAELRTHAANKWSRAARSFRYENVWQSHAQYDELVRSIWMSGAG